MDLLLSSATRQRFVPAFFFRRANILFPQNMNIVVWFKNRRVIRKRILPYLRLKETQLLHSEKISEGIDEEISCLCDRLKEQGPNRYEGILICFEGLPERIKEHNKAIEEIDRTMEGFSLPSILENPLNHTIEELASFDQTLNNIESFHSKSQPYETFCKDLKDLSSDLPILQDQYRVLQLFKEAFQSGKNYYFGKWERQKFEERWNSIPLWRKHTHRNYYDLSTCDGLSETIRKHNLEYFEKHIDDPLFDDIQGHSLDRQQRMAILKDEQSNLIVAGAGSGKTTTICGKIKFLLENNHISPEDILLLSYSRKSADDLQEKAKKIDERLTVGTFHQLGLNILRTTEGHALDVEEQFDAIIESYFRDELWNRTEVAGKVLQFFANYLSDNDQKKKYKDKGELYEDLKIQNLTTLKDLKEQYEGLGRKETIKKEIVKSFEEMAIANFYFLNGIDYVYEKPYEINVSTADKRQYRPDFYLPEYKIYHEHYGIDEKGRANQYEPEEARDYVENIKWKRNLHEENGTICFETYSYEFKNGTVFDTLTKKLREKGVELRPLSEQQIKETLQSIYGGRNFKSFINLVKSFLNLYKSRYPTSETFEELKEHKFETGYQKRRARLFLEIVEDVYSYYFGLLRSRNRIDFDDMILLAKGRLDQTPLFAYRYIIVDEFQDISYSRAMFLKRLIQQGNSRLFAVGDDWQAIYRFAGCDLNIFLKFDQYFENAQTSSITTTYRNSQELQDIAGPFIKANPEQYDKKVVSPKHLQKPIKILYYIKDKIPALMAILKSIHSLSPCAHVLLLGRNSKDIEDFLSETFYRDKSFKDGNGQRIKSKAFPDLTITFNTVHASKGLEDEFVVVVNADNARLGFPNKMEDDAILNLVLSSETNYPFAEERRLWYVALTRTKNYTYILANKFSPSNFVEEIKNQCEELSFDCSDVSQDTQTCPECKSGRLILRVRESDGKEFIGCSNYPYCRYTIDDQEAVKRDLRCPICGDFMVERRGKTGTFFGCHNYPQCQHTIDRKSYKMIMKYQKLFGDEKK